ncbi:MAG: B12-binding domain-containing protein [Opitutales bacterium]
MNLDALEEAIKAGKRKDAVAQTSQALEAQANPGDILAAMVRGMDDVGRRFKANEIYIPEVLVAARAMKQAMQLLEPALAGAGLAPKYTAVIGTVEGDLHDIGKNLVAMMWKGANFRVIDLGTNVTADQFVEAARANDAHIIGLSSLLTTTMPKMKETVARIREANLPQIRIVVGGAPVTQEFADEIQADGFSTDAASAVDLVRELMGEASTAQRSNRDLSQGYTIV